ncbi:hypothetical protein SDC9_160814 [bioreactor metagenome]|uniref:Uncharacterized protein n=1 Tax=bioreactor metagenome TaxID=1076179 RepID=A0A645FMR5_9ZZZZ
MDERAHLFGGQVEELHRLYTFYTLIHQSGAVDRYLRPHLPDGVVERRLRRHPFHLFRAVISERAAGGGQPDTRELIFRSVAQTLPEGAVLAVHGAKLIGPFYQRHHPRAGDDDALLVCERDVYAARKGLLQGLYCRDARRSEYGVVHGGFFDHRRKPLFAGKAEESLLAPVFIFRFGQAEYPGVVLSAELRQLLRVAPR